MDYTLVNVDKSDSTSITQQIVNLMLKNIDTQSLMPGDKLPTERELAERLNVARGTVKAAYKKLERQNIVVTRQGSGTFIMRDEGLSGRRRKEKAVSILNKAIADLTQLGVSSTETERLFDFCMSQMPKKVIDIAIIHEAPELLLDFKRQLSYLPDVSVSIFILESITEDANPEDLLRGFDIVVAPTGGSHDIAGMLPGIKDKIVKSAISPISETMIQLSAMPRNSRVGIICRSNTFLAIVKDFLRDYDFEEENILSFFEMDYTIETYFPGGIDALISFGDAHIFTNPEFKFRNEEFWAKGGKIIAFKHHIERGTLIYIEDKVRNIRTQKLIRTGFVEGGD